MNKSIEQRVVEIEKRNLRVEKDKAWEISWFRRLLISALTYATVISYLYVINNDKPLLNGLVPVTGYLLSTLAVRRAKDWWMNK